MALLSLLYRDESIVAIDKPSALLVHRSRISRDHVFALQLVRDQIGQFVYPVHRLDRATSGVLLMALSSDIASRLAPLFAEGRIHKTYLAVVRGFLPAAEGVIDHPLRESPDALPKPALTRYHCLATAEWPHPVGPNPSARYSLALAIPQTGRTHQIRRHFKHINHPVAGDTQHGDGRHNRFLRESFGLERLLLHALQLDLPHPVSGEPISIRAPLPPDFTGPLASWHSFTHALPRPGASLIH